MDAKLQLNPVVLGDLKRAAQHVLDFFCQLGLVRLAMLFSLDAGAKVIDLLGQLSAFFEQASHDLKRLVVVGEPAAKSHADRHEAFKSGLLFMFQPS